MNVTADPLPDIERTDAGLITFSEWTLDSRERQQTAMDAAIDAWTHVPWPDGLLAHTCLGDAEGPTLRHHSQWTSAAAFEHFQRTDSPQHFASIQAAVGGRIDRHDLATYDLYRSFHSTSDLDKARARGCIVVVDIFLEGPNPATQRAWVDAVFDALDAEAPTGLIAAHFHTSTDGTRIVNYAEWTTAQAHRDALAAGVEGSINRDDAPEWRRVREFPGIADLSRFTRYTRHRSTAVPA
ncbi:MAG: antibiotic biosynthesis monooxygenase [Actinomycetota bacterium]|nr:antibiotic biosynthesis monooxygenase [Actinomycetota bacterium]